jgi:hypothetical protein
MVNNIKMRLYNMMKNRIVNFILSPLKIGVNIIVLLFTFLFWFFMFLLFLNKSIWGNFPLSPYRYLLFSIVFLFILASIVFSINRKIKNLLKHNIRIRQKYIKVKNKRIKELFYKTMENVGITFLVSLLYIIIVSLIIIFILIILSILEIGFIDFANFVGLNIFIFIMGILNIVFIIIIILNYISIVKNLDNIKKGNIRK